LNDEVLVPVTFWDFRLRFNPGKELIEIGDADCPSRIGSDQMLADTFWRIVPTLNLGISR